MALAGGDCGRRWRAAGAPFGLPLPPLPEAELSGSARAKVDLPEGGLRRAGRRAGLSPLL